jgi:Rrf2 family protein
MTGVLRISEASSLALHTMVLLAARPGEHLSVGRIASALGVSGAHLSKVLQRLARVGLVRSVRGPKGGFALGRSAEEITLLDVYEAIEGPLSSSACLLARPICEGKRCILGKLLVSVNEQVRKHLAEARLSELPSPFWRKHAHAARDH